jgi:hypothetical protein
MCKKNVNPYTCIKYIKAIIERDKQLINTGILKDILCLQIEAPNKKNGKYCNRGKEKY